MLTLNRTDSPALQDTMSDSVARSVLHREFERLGASASEIAAARAFAAADALFDPRAYEALSPRMRRLVDLVTVADGQYPSCAGSAETQPGRPGPTTHYAGATA